MARSEDAMIRVGRISEITRYPIKSMAGVSTESATLGWHGLAGDRRFALRRIDDGGGFPWLTASSLPELVLYRPLGLDERAGEPLPTHVRTPAGRQFELRSAELRDEISERLGRGVEMMWLRNGIFDDAAVSIISQTTVAEVGRAAGLGLDHRRFRTNIVVESEGSAPFDEDQWVGQTLVFGETNAGPALRVTHRDVRCMMVNLDPDTAMQDARVMKSVVRLNQNCAGVYAAVAQIGTICVGDRVSIFPGNSR
jgi:uncharacterized protein YcbX